jgi:hypothetical protein
MNLRCAPGGSWERKGEAVSLEAGDRVPEFSVFRGFKDPIGSRELLAEGPTLVHFYVFDFSGSPEGG